MKLPNSDTALLGETSFAELELALRRGEELTAWPGVFEQIVERVSAAIRRQYPDAPFQGDAVQSAT